MAAALCAVALGTMPVIAQTVPTPAGMVTVVVEVSLTSGSSPAEALAALSDIRAMMKRQPGYLSEEFLQNLNASNTPQYIHVSRWASMTYWAALFRTAPFGQLTAHGNQHYMTSVSAFLPYE